MAEAPGHIEAESAANETFEAKPTLPGPPQPEPSEKPAEPKYLSDDENTQGDAQTGAPEVALGEMEQQIAEEEPLLMEVEIPTDFPPTQEMGEGEEISTDFPPTQVMEQSEDLGMQEEIPAEALAISTETIVETEAEPQQVAILPATQEIVAEETVAIPEPVAAEPMQEEMLAQIEQPTILQEGTLPMPAELVSPPSALMPEAANIPSPQPDVAKPIRDILSRLLGKGREASTARVNKPPPSYNDPAYYTWQDPNRTPSPPPARRSRNVSRRQFQPFSRNAFSQHPNNWGNWGPPNRKRRRNNKPKKSQKVDPSLPHRKSKYRGVYWERRDQKWRARAYCMGKRYSAGSYTVEREAALAVNRLCRKLGVPLQNPQLEAIVLDDYEAPPIKPYRPRKKKQSNIFEGKYPPVKRESYGYMPYVKTEPAGYYDEPRDALDY